MQKARRFGDARGWFMETYSEATALAAFDSPFEYDGRPFEPLQAPGEEG